MGGEGIINGAKRHPDVPELKPVVIGFPTPSFVVDLGRIESRPSD